MCDIGTMILAESKRGGISAADFGTYLARPVTPTHYANTQSVHKPEGGKRHSQHTGHRRDNGVYSCP